MKAWRAFGKLACMAVVFAGCFVLLVRAIGPRSPWLGLLLMFYFMGLAQAAEPLFRLRLPRFLRAATTNPATARLHRRLGVHRFGAWLRQAPLRYLNTGVYRAHGDRELAALRAQVDSAEAIHFWAALFFTPYIAYVGVKGYVADAASFVLVQVLFNIYPILHLRLVRARLDRVERSATARRCDTGPG